MTGTTLGRVVCALLGVLATAGLSHAGAPLSNDAAPIAVCQETIRTATLQLAIASRRALSACLTRGIECVAAAEAAQGPCCERAAGRCRNDFAKLERVRARFASYVQHRRCSVVPFADIASADGLGYERLAEACAGFGASRAVADLAGLTECLDRLVVADTACQLGTRELPRSDESLACTELEGEFRRVTGTDLANCRAPAATATPMATLTPSLTPMRTVTPVASPSPTVAPSGTAIATSSATATPISAIPTATATPVVAVCGNNIIEAGEDCDDGNLADCDECPATCKSPVPCQASTTRFVQKVRLRPPQGALLQGALACVGYSVGAVALPGAKPDGTGQVSGRVSGVSGVATANDFNNAVQLGLLLSPAVAEVNATISFDLCTGAPPPPLDDFMCVVKNASNQGNPIDPPSLVECTPVAS